MPTHVTRSPLLDAVHETAQDLLTVGLITKRRMHEDEAAQHSGASGACSAAVSHARHALSHATRYPTTYGPYRCCHVVRTLRPRDPTAPEPTPGAQARRVKHAWAARRSAVAKPSLHQP